MTKIDLIFFCFVFVLPSSSTCFPLLLLLLISSSIFGYILRVSCIFFVVFFFRVNSCPHPRGFRYRFHRYNSWAINAMSACASGDTRNVCKLLLSVSRHIKIGSGVSFVSLNEAHTSLRPIHTKISLRNENAYQSRIIFHFVHVWFFLCVLLAVTETNAGGHNQGIRFSFSTTSFSVIRCSVWI